MTTKNLYATPCARESHPIKVQVKTNSVTVKLSNPIKDFYPAYRNANRLVLEQSVFQVSL